MKEQRIRGLLALVLALLLALPCLALAEEDAVATETVENVIAAEEEWTLDAPVEEPVEEPAEEAFDEPAEETAEEAVEEPAEEPSEEAAVENAEAPVGEAAEPRFEASVSEAEAQTLEAPAEASVVEEAAVETSLKAAVDGPTAVAIDVSKGADFWLGMGPSQLNVLVEPATATTTYKWKSSNKKVVKVNSSGVITPRKAGKAKITVTTGNKKKSTVKVTIHKNLVNNINPKPSKAQIQALGAGWNLWLKSAELTAGGKYVAKFYLLNNLGKSKRITDFGVQLYVGDTLVAQKYLSKVKVACAKGKAKAFKVTFSGADIVAGPVLLPQYGAANVRFELMTAPKLVYGKNKSAVIQSAQQATDSTVTGTMTTDSTTGQTIDTNTGEIITVNLDELAAKAITLVNAQRTSRGLSALKTTSELTRAAKVRAKELLVYYDHTRPNGSDFYTVSKKANGENIAFGFSSAELVVDGWMNSPGHKANILTKSFKTTGLAAAISDVDGFVYWVQLFGEDSK